MRAVVFGAGRLGCGLVAPALVDGGYDVSLVAKEPRVAEHLASTGGYRLRIADGPRVTEREVSGIRVISLAERAAVVDAVAASDVVATAVGTPGLASAAPVLAAGLGADGSVPTTVLTFENGTDPARRLRALLAAEPAGAARADTWTVAGALASRIVARRLGNPHDRDPFTFVADPPNRIAVDATAVRHPFVPVPGMILTPDYAAEVRRKLSVFSAGHAAAAYIGYLKGYRYVHAAVRDPEVRDVVLGVMAEGQLGVSARYGERFAGTADLLQDTLHRFENAALDDVVTRVGRQAVRKLGPTERLVGTAVLAEEAGHTPHHLPLVLAAALCFHLRREDDAEGADPLATVRDVLTRVAGLSLDRGLGRRAFEAFLELAPGVVPGNTLLHLHQQMWSRAAVPAVYSESEILQ
jgi:mannitol-1-phosphate 5-dehydrogenase